MRSRPQAWELEMVPPAIEHDLVNPRRQGLQRIAIIRIRQVQERPESKPALAGVGVEGPGEVLLLEQGLQPLQDEPESIGWDRNIVEDGDRSTRSAKPHQEGLDEPAPATIRSQSARLETPRARKPAGPFA